jgi:hypothetical protein
MAHHLGDPFYQCEPSVSFILNHEQFDTLNNLNRERERLARIDFERSASNVRRHRDKMVESGDYENLPPDERASMDRVAG